MKVKKRIIFFLVMVLVISGFPFVTLAANQSVVIQSFEAIDSLDKDSKIEDEIIVIYENDASLKDLALTTSQIEAGEKLNDQVDILKVRDTENIDALILDISKNPDVLVAEKNFTVQTFGLPNDPDLNLSWQFERIGADKTWDKIDNKDPIVVAVIDTGLDTKHPDLIGRTVAGYDFMEESDDVIDLGGHGTNVSGCITAVANNGIGIAGAVGTANVKIAPYRVGGIYEGDTTLNGGYICAALYEAANRSDIQVINMSFGSYNVSSAMRIAVAHAAAKGKLLVASSGNAGNDRRFAGEFAVPASYENVISVGATDIHNRIANFSQFNPQVDLCAPGEDIYTTGLNGSYKRTSGTSFSAPITAGAGALLLAADPSLRPIEVEQILKETVIDFSQKGHDNYYGYGMIQLDKALAKVKPNIIQSYHDLEALDRDAKIDDEIVVIYQNQGSVKDLMLTTNQIEAGERLNDQVDLIKVSDPSKVDDLVSELEKNPQVLAAERNSRLKLSALPNDPLLEQAWQFERIGADQTWDQVDNEKTVVVAVIDTGLNIYHPDIEDNIVAGYDYVDDHAQMKDVVGHGTAVSGCIAAVTNNELGIPGVAGTANIKIAPYRAGGETEDDLEVNLAYVAAALYDAANRPEVGVINMSFGEYKPSTILENAIKYAAKAGKVLVCSSGNEGDEAEAGQTSIPSSYDHVISVGATNQENTIADFSQYNDKVDLCAPGVATLTLGERDTYVAPSGTSFSSPIVAGAAAVLLAADPTLTPDQVETLLKETAIDLSGKGRDDYYGYGLIQLDKALAKVTPKDQLRISYFGADKLTGQKIGTTIGLDAVAMGGSGNYNYAFYYQLNGKTEMIQNFSQNDKASFIPSQPGIYKFKAIVKDDNNDLASSELINYVIKDPQAIVSYRTHVENVGWQELVENGQASGTEGQSLRLEAIDIRADSIDYELGIKYKTHVQNKDWQEFVADGALSGTEGESLRLEAIKMELTGKDADLFDLYYQVHAQNKGWLDWAKNGEAAGTEGFGYRLEAIKIQLVSKGSPAPGQVERAYIKKQI